MAYQVEKSRGFGVGPSASEYSRRVEFEPVPRIAVVILSFNQREQTLLCLRHLLALAQSEGPFDVLLWDNGSIDGTAEVVRETFPAVRVNACSRNLGVAGGRNAAARMALEQFEPTLLLFLDNDIYVRDGFVSALARAFSESGGAGIGQVQAKLLLSDPPGSINYGGGSNLQFWRGNTRPVGYGEVDRGQYDQRKPCVACGGAMMVRADVFQKLGGFDELFSPYGPEDIDFSLRLQSAGWESWYIPDAVGVHDYNHTFASQGYTHQYAAHRSKHWMDLMRRHASPMQWAGFFFVGLPIIASRVMLREARKGNALAALRGLFRGAIARAGSSAKR
jgi:GT2 family glycosyltransferase